MKKIVLTLLTLLVVTVSFSQVKVSPGIKTGLNASTVSDLNNATRKIGVNVAVFVGIKLAKFYELQPEFTYSNQGWSSDEYYYIDPYGDVTFSNSSEDINLHYIGMGIANKFFVAPNIGLHFVLGPSLEFRISDDISYDDVTPIDFALFGGIGYEFPFGLGLEARYKQGLIDIREGYYDYYFDDYENDNDYYYRNNKLNSVFQFNVYYKFGW